MIVEVLIPGIPGPPGTGQGGVSEITGPAVLGRVSGTGAPQGLTPAQGRQALDLGNVNNTSDANKPISGAMATALAGKEAIGTAAAAIAAHLAASDSHPNYLTQGEAGALYAPLASVHDSVSLGATVADVLGLTGQQLTADDPGAGADRLLFWDHSVGRLRYLALGANLTITDTSIAAAGATDPGGYPAFSAPTGFNVGGSGTASITLSFATGYSLPATASQASWDAAAGLAATAIQTGDSRLTDAREWSAATVTQAAAQAGTETTRRAWTVERVWQAAAAWWQSISGATGRSLAGAASPAAGRAVLELGTAATTASTDYVTAVTGTAPIGSSGGVTPAISISAATTTAAGSMSGADKAKIDGISIGATANATDAQLRDRGTHTGTQSAATITGLASVATSGAYADLSGRPTLGTAATTDATAYAAASHNQSASTITGLASVATSGAYADLSGRPTLGTAAALNTGTAAGNVVALDGSARLPAVDGSQLTNLPGGTGGTSRAVRIDSTSTANTIYVGKAPAGSSEAAAVWSITRTQFSAAGVQTGSSTITAFTWTGRTTHAY